MRTSTDIENAVIGDLPGGAVFSFKADAYKNIQLKCHDSRDKFVRLADGMPGCVNEFEPVRWFKSAEITL